MDTTKALLKRTGLKKTVVSRRGLLYLALLIAILVAIRLQWSRLQDPLTFQDDFRKFHWMLRYEDPELFVADPLTDHYISEIEIGSFRLFVDKTRPGYSLLFFLASLLVSPVLFNKLLVFPLLLISVYFLFRIGEIARDPAAGFILSLTFIVLTTLWTASTSVAVGLPRSFMAPLLLGTVYFLMTDRYWMATGVTLIAATIYLPGAVLGIATIGLATLEPTSSRWRYRIIWRRILPLVVLFVLLLFMLPVVGRQLESVWANLLNNIGSLGEILQNPRYIDGGRLALFTDFPFQGLGALSEDYVNVWLLVLLTPLSVAIYILIPQAYKQFPRALKLLFGASVILYFLAWLAMFLTSSLALYFPSRYTQTSLPLVLLIFVVLNLGLAVRSFWSRFLKLKLSSKGLTIAGAVAVTVTLFLLLGQQNLWIRVGAARTSFKEITLVAFAFLSGSVILVGLSGKSVSEPGLEAERPTAQRSLSILMIIMLATLVLIGLPPNGQSFFTIDAAQEDLYAFFQSTPKDSLTAGDPCALNNIPIAAGRQVFFTCEFFSQGASARILDNFRAYYADSLSEVQEFCAAYDVDYFIVVPRKFDFPEPKWIFYEPYGSLLQPEVASQAGYVLEDIPDSMRVYEDENFVVMRCGIDNIGEITSMATQVEGLGILNHNEIPEKLAQAGEIELTVKWVAEKEMLTDYDICFLVNDTSRDIRQEVCQTLSPKVPTSRWLIPEIRYESYQVQISPYLESGDYSIVASVKSGEEPYSADGVVLGETTYSTHSRQFSSANVNSKLASEVIWGDVIGLTYFNVSPSELNSLDLDVSWLALQRMPESYKFFAHLRRADTGEIASQIDSIPLDWTYPTNWWEANELVTDMLSIPLADLGQGRYELWIGFYNEESGERLPLVIPANPLLVTEEDAVKIYEYEQ